MIPDYEKMIEAIKEFPNTPAGKAYFENMRKINDIRVSRYKRFEEWLKHNDFEALMYRLIHEHGDDYQEKCMHKGYEPYPNRKLAFLIDYLVHNYEPIEVPEIEPEHFPSTIYFFKGYYFQTICGQGCFHRIYNKEDMRLVLQV
jgi:hypothetical protein